MASKKKRNSGRKQGPAFEGLTIRDCRRVAREQFRIDPLYPEQVVALRSLLKERDTSVVLPTGYGKSLIYQVLAVLADRPVVTLFPLIALMRDQELALERYAVPVVRLDSTLGQRARTDALARVQRGGQLVVLTTPETLAAEDLRVVLKKTRPALLCVDEAHCISEWGHDFRPAYLRVGIERAALGNPTVLALTRHRHSASANRYRRAAANGATDNRVGVTASRQPALSGAKHAGQSQIICRRETHPTPAASWDCLLRDH